MKNAKANRPVKSPLLPCGHTKEEHQEQRKENDLTPAEIKRFQAMLGEIGSGKRDGFIFIGGDHTHDGERYFDGVLFRHNFTTAQMLRALTKSGSVNIMELLPLLAEGAQVIKVERESQGDGHD